MTVRFSHALVAEAIQPFWAALQAGEFLTEASALAGTHRHRGLAWLREAGGVRPRRGRDLKGRCLSFSEREEIALGRAGGETIRAIAARPGCSPSTVSRELTRNADRSGRYRATRAHALAYARASRPKPSKLLRSPREPKEPLPGRGLDGVLGVKPLICGTSAAGLAAWRRCDARFCGSAASARVSTGGASVLVAPRRHAKPPDDATSRTDRCLRIGQDVTTADEAATATRTKP